MGLRRWSSRLIRNFRNALKLLQMDDKKNIRSGPFLTLGSGISIARNENSSIEIYPPISGKYGLRNQFWPLESRFSHADTEEKFKL